MDKDKLLIEQCKIKSDNEFYRIKDIVSLLRKLCPWDKKQTFESLRANTIEEAHELCSAIMKKDAENIKEELGDVLLHILLYSKIAEEQGLFSFDDVCTTLSEKMIFRHPHIFGATSADSAEQVELNWEKIKQKEKGGKKRVLDGVPEALPSIVKAYRIQDKARNVGFDWNEKEQVWDKVKEEFEELKAEISKLDDDKMEAEFGDFLFSIINAGRLYKINPDNALERTNAKFIRRFNYVEDAAMARGRKVSDLSLEEMDKYWNEAKKSEK